MTWKVEALILYCGLSRFSILIFVPPFPEILVPLIRNVFEANYLRPKYLVT